MRVLQSNVIDVQFVNILYLSSPECVRQSALLLDIEEDAQKKVWILCIYLAYLYV